MLCFFLPRFFTNLGHCSAPARRSSFRWPQHRAAALFYHMATARSTAPGHWLSLNKVLCGLDLSGSVQFAAVVDRRGEPKRTRRTVVDRHRHAACPAGDFACRALAAPFLLRKGALTTRDGAWLLRVDRQVYDVVLEGLPWRNEWIRLPWMVAPLRVEW